MGTDDQVIPAFEQWFHDQELPSKVKEDCKDAWLAAVRWADDQHRKAKS